MVKAGKPAVNSSLHVCKQHLIQKQKCQRNIWTLVAVCWHKICKRISKHFCDGGLLDGCFHLGEEWFLEHNRSFSAKCSLTQKINSNNSERNLSTESIERGKKKKEKGRSGGGEQDETWKCRNIN